MILSTKSSDSPVISLVMTRPADEKVLVASAVPKPLIKLELFGSNVNYSPIHVDWKLFEHARHIQALP